MYKEAVICIISVIIIISLNCLTENYTRESVSELTDKLMGLRENIKKESVDDKQALKNIKFIFQKWNDKYDILAYYLEHDELEKVETNLTAIRGYIETKEYSSAVGELDKTIFILYHIEEKNKLDFKNIF